MSRRVDAALFLGLSIIWGFSFPAIAVGLETLPPLLFAGFRYGIAAVLLLWYATARLEHWRPTARADLFAVVGGGLFLFAGNGLLFVGQQTVPSGVAAILQALVPIATAVWALVLLGERISPLGAVGAAVGFLGIGLVVQPDPSNLLAGDTVGRLIIVGQVASVALGGVIVQRADATLGRPALIGWSMALGALVLFGISRGLGERVGADAVTTASVTAVLYLGVVATAVAFFVYYSILEERGAFEASLVAYIVPVVATIVGVVFLNETIGLISVFGFALVAVGFALLKRQTLVDAIGTAVSPGGA